MVNLDRKCKTILKTLIMQGRDIRFNELHRRVKKIDSEFSKPTFLFHLNHLKKGKYIVRKKKGKQNVTYGFNYEKFKYLDSFVKYQNLVNEYLNEEEGFLKGFSNLGTLLLIKPLQSLKIKVLEYLEPKRKSELTLQSLIINELLLKPVEDWILQKCKIDEKYRKELLEAVDGLTEFNIRAIFENHEEILREIESLVI